MDISQFSWVADILKSVVSGVIVFFLTRWLMNKRERTEYLKQVDRANKSVIDTLKPYIADRGLPKVHIFEYLIDSTARNHDVAQKDMLSISDYCKELVREVLRDAYVSGERKEEHVTALAEYISNLNSYNSMQEAAKNQFAKPTSKRLSSAIAGLAALMTGVLSLVMSSYELLKSSSFSILENSPFWMPIILVVLVLLLFLCAASLEMALKSLRKHHKSKSSASSHRGNRNR